MTLALGMQLKIRAMIHVAAEPIPFYWPIRAFIHHNPLHGLEHLPFPEAVKRGERLFHGRGYLHRALYQEYLRDGNADHAALASFVDRFSADRETLPGIDLTHWLMTLLTATPVAVSQPRVVAQTADIHAAVAGRQPAAGRLPPLEALRGRLRAGLLGDRPVYEAIDQLFGAGIGSELDELVIKSCLDFFDEGQSVWAMPDREQGFFRAWRDVAQRNVRLFLRGLSIRRILDVSDSPEGIIAHVLTTLGVPENDWVGYFSRELVRLHGWAGFIRWRSGAKHYYMANRFPGDLVDFMAVRLTFALALLESRGRRRFVHTRVGLGELIDERTAETWLRHELYGGDLLPAYAHRIEDALARGRPARIDAVFADYIDAKRTAEAQRQADAVQRLAQAAGGEAALSALDPEQLGRLLETLADFEQREGVCWLRSLEARAMGRLLAGVDLAPSPPRDKRPFVQALFCIDTRSERIRRHLEGVGDYQTYGIAGFFGVPVSFMELGKGSEVHLSPVIVTPKNLVPELTAAAPSDEAALTALEKVLHELKESVLTPFVTVEAIGLLFGFDMVGKTLAPQAYNRWRQHLHQHKPTTRLLLDKLSREQADSIVRAVQRALIVKAVEQEIGLTPDRITDAMIRELREAALGNTEGPPGCAVAMGLSDQRAAALIDRLRGAYRINRSYASVQMERLGRIGFTPDEQAHFVANALRSIGLTEQLSRFILLCGHGSTSENNPYESALDCGACGGNHGLVSARVLAQMANRPAVRRRLRRLGLDIPDDVWFLSALHNTTTDEIQLHDLDLLPSSHLIYLDRLRSGLAAASRLCAQERLPSLELKPQVRDPAAAYLRAQRNAMDWSQVRPEWGLSRNAYFVIGRRHLTQASNLDGRAFLHSYNYRIDPKRRLLENILAGPLVVGQWINMEHYFSAVDNERFGSGTKINHNVAGRFGVMTGNLSDLRTGLPSQTVLKDGKPYHEPLRLITVIEAPFEHARAAIEHVVGVKRLVHNVWIRMLVLDPETHAVTLFEDGEWQARPGLVTPPVSEEA